MSIYPVNVGAPRAPRAQRLLEDERGIADDRSFSEVIFGSFGGGLQRREWAKSLQVPRDPFSVPTAVNRRG